MSKNSVAVIKTYTSVCLFPRKANKCLIIPSSPKTWQWYWMNLLEPYSFSLPSKLRATIFCLHTCFSFCLEILPQNFTNLAPSYHSWFSFNITNSKWPSNLSHFIISPCFITSSYSLASLIYFVFAFVFIWPVYVFPLKHSSNYYLDDFGKLQSLRPSGDPQMRI